MKLFNLCLFIGTLLFFSCNKDSENNNSDITGDWKFVSKQIKYMTSRQSNASPITLSTSTADFTSTYNNGFFRIEADKISGVDLSYRLESIRHEVYYENGVVIDSSDYPMQGNTPRFTSTGSYKKVGSDSLAFIGETPMFASTEFGGSSSMATGLRFKKEGNKLTLFTTISHTNTFETAGVPTKIDDEVHIRINLEKQ